MKKAYIVSLFISPNGETLALDEICSCKPEYAGMIMNALRKDGNFKHGFKFADGSEIRIGQSNINPRDYRKHQEKG